MTELPIVHEPTDGMPITTTIVIDDERAHSQSSEFTYLAYSSDVPGTTTSGIRVDLTTAFDGTHTADEIAARVIAEWIHVFCRCALGPGSKDGVDTLLTTLRDRPALYGAYVGFARAQLLAAETEIADGRENVSREFRTAVEQFSPDKRVCNEVSSDVCRRVDVSASESGGQVSTATSNEQDGDADITVESAAETVSDLSECDTVWQRQYDDIITSDDEQVYVQTGDSIEAIKTATGELAWETPVGGECTGLRHPQSPIGPTLCLRRDDDLLALDTTTGERRATITIEDRISSWALLDADRLALVHAESERRQKAPFINPTEVQTYIPRGFGSPTLSVYSLSTGDLLTAHTDLEINRIDGHIEDTLYFHESEGSRLTAIDATTGDHTWTVQFESGITDVAYLSGLSDEGIIACATGAGNVSGLSPASGRREWVCSPPVARPTEEIRRHGNRADIDENWEPQAASEPVQFLKTHETETLYVVDRAQKAYTSLNPETGQEHWRYWPAADDIEFQPDFATIADDTLYIAEGVAHEEYFSPPTRFRAIDVVTGTEHWETVVENRASSIEGVNINDGHLIAEQFDGTMMVSLDTGAYELYERAGYKQLPSATGDDGVLVAGDADSLHGIAVEVFGE